MNRAVVFVVVVGPPLGCARRTPSAVAALSAARQRPTFLRPAVTSSPEVLTGRPQTTPCSAAVVVFVVLEEMGRCPLTNFTAISVN